ncbi:hypothetical protein EDB84DRAFT_1492372 [Lactarius hengduanensis]|nr:hypothetical protein EDB84DRAFT_1492372 [Lactarius hengduanensis]
MSFAPNWDDVYVKHTWDAVPANWESVGPPPSGTTIDLHIALNAHRENALTDALYEVSDPRHPKYGSHLSKAQVAALVAPHPDALALVHSWLEHHGVPPASVSATHGGGWLTLYRHAVTHETVLRTLGYALPAALLAHVQTVAPTTHFGSPHARGLCGATA